MNKWPSVYPRHLLGAAFDSAFNLRARFYFWARQGQGEPRPRGRSIEGPAGLPGPLRASLPKQPVGEGALGSTEWWGAAHSAVGCQGCLSASVQCGTPRQGSPGRACDMGLAVARASSLWPGSRPAHASQPRGPSSGMQGSHLSWRQAAPSGTCTHLEWGSANLSISAPPSPQNPSVECREAGVLSLVKYSRARPSIFLFYACRAAVYF